MPKNSACEGAIHEHSPAYCIVPGIPNCSSRLANVSYISNGHSSRTCEITELDVVRGRSDWTRIDHDGFLVVTDGTEITVFVSNPLIS